MSSVCVCMCVCACVCCQNYMSERHEVDANREAALAEEDEEDDGEDAEHDE